jgi:AcrR family transcriptional regulator
MPKPLTASDWERTALVAIAENGLQAVAVEPLARRLGVTKGSFYWHFPNRRALLSAAISRWEQDQLAGLEGPSPADPPGQLQALVDRALKLLGQPTVQRRLTAEADRDPQIAAALARVTQARIKRIEAIYTAFGLPRKEARARAAVAYAAVLGLEQIDRVGELRIGEQALVRELLATLTPSPGPLITTGGPRLGAEAL